MDNLDMATTARPHSKTRSPHSKERSPTGSDGFRALCERVQACFDCSSMNHVHILGDVNGSLDADVLFVAEAPGRLGAARTGIPMTSDVTGRRFHAFLAEAGLDRSRVFITNAILCNPLTAQGSNRRPTSREVAACGDFLAAQVGLVRAPIVVALGGVALEALRSVGQHEAVLARDVGCALPWAAGERERTLVPLYHPSIQSTLTRPHETQRDDWRRLGELVRGRIADAVPG
ncbi:MAG: uracil-DNA glycosylase [Chloroflexi bacterium]|nr:uracil-DNA glycosylase [Chloroflexota bacterium]